MSTGVRMMFQTSQDIAFTRFCDSQERYAQFIRQRVALFNDEATFWGRNRNALIDIERSCRFPDSAYYQLPDDPVTSFPEVWWSVVLLKRRYLNRVRQKFLKAQRNPHLMRRIQRGRG